MGRIYIDNDNGVPQLACTDCGSCGSIMGKSFCSGASRGCCHYFPEFNLAEIHRMLHLPGGSQVLKTIMDYPGTVVNNFALHSRGYFDREGYENYIAGGQLLETGDIKDHTIFFRTCPFVREGCGCMFPARFRTTVCNFFICGEIFGKPGLEDSFRPYIEERSRYSSWVHRESLGLQHILTENGVNLALDFQASLRLLAELPLSGYEFPLLTPVEYS